MAQYVVDEAPFLSGLAAARAERERFNDDQNRALRYQELQSEATLRKVQERQIAQHTAMLIQEQNQKIQQQADTAKAWQQTQLETSPVLPAPGMLGGVMPNPDPMPMYRSLLKNMGPVIAKYKMENLGPFVQDMALLPYREAEAKRQEALAKEYANGGFQPTSATVNVPMPDGTTRAVPGIKTSRNSWQPMIDPSVQMMEYTDPKTGETTQRPLVRTGMSGGRVLPDDIGERQKLEDERQRQKIALQWLFTNDRTDLVKWDQRGAPFADATAMQTASQAGVFSGSAKGAAEKQQMSMENALLASDSALKTIDEHPEAIGIAGAGRDIAERLKGQVGLPTGGSPVAKARHNLELTFTQLADGLRVDTGNMSRYERNKLELVGDPSRWQESEDTARNMMENIQKALVAKSLRIARDLGKQPDDAVLKRISGTEIISLVSEHLLSKEAAQRWWDLKNPAKSAK